MQSHLNMQQSKRLLTLQLRSLSNKMFLAAISLWTKDLRARQARPSTTCLQNWSSKLGRSGLDSSDGLEGEGGRGRKRWRGVEEEGKGRGGEGRGRSEIQKYQLPKHGDIKALDINLTSCKAS